MTAQASGSMRDVAAVLERFLCPGGKLRLSPYVEAAQCSVLLGELPDPKHHAASLRAIVARPEHADKLDAIAQLLLEAPAVGFGDAFFAHRDFLDFYLAHYFPANLGKLQIVLLDLLRAGHFPHALHLVDLGVGPGTSFVAVLDFVLALGALADLVGAVLPLRELSLRGFDRSPVCLTYAREVVNTFGRVLTAYGGRPGAGPALTAAWDLVEKAGAGIELQQGDLGGVGAVAFAGPSFVVLSYALNDLFEQGRVEGFEARLAGLATGSQLVVLEPGHARLAAQLMCWRRSLVRRIPHLRPLLPCGQEFGRRLPAACDDCWCARREEIHVSSLQRAYLDRLDGYLEALDPERQWQVRRGFERLSWSYCVLAAQAHEEQPDENPLPQSAAQRYIGQRRADRSGTLSVAEETVAPVQERRLVAFCPARVELAPSACRSALLVQEPGKVLPPLRFGELVVLENVEVRREDAGALFTMSRTSRVRPAAPAISLPHPDAQPATLNALAQRLFGFSALHDFQHKIIRRVLAGRNTLGIAATGAGKTESFLLPALLLPGLTVVVSPLKSLMQDQWERCDERYGLGALTTYLNGDVPFQDRTLRLQGMRAGRYKLAYFTPEQLARPYIRAVLQQTAVSVLAIDEAHCVSQWGHDFRPDYLNMVRRLQACWDKQPAILALTATAGERVRRDLCDPALFNLDNRPVEEGGDVVFYGSNRLELDLIVRVEPNAAARGRHIREDLQPFAQETTSGSALVFLPYTGATHAEKPEEEECSAAVEPFAAYLERQLGQRVATYHGQMGEGLQTETGTFLRTRWRRPDNTWGVYIFQGQDETFCGAGTLLEPQRGVHYHLVGRWQDFAKYGRQFVFESWTDGTEAAPPERNLGDVSGRDRRGEQRAFMHSQKRIMVATKSFGMGIDKADIRLVLHHSPPGDLLSYAQEVGRAARDGNQGRVILYFTEGAYQGGKGYALTDRRIQERFLDNRYVRESDLRAGIAFLRQCRRRLEVPHPPPGVGQRTCAIFSFNEVSAYFDGLSRDPTPAGLPRPYEWPPYKERQKVVQLTLEVLFKTVIATGARTARLSLLESCEEVAPCLLRPVRLDWHGLEDSNADLLREVLERAQLGRAEFESLCTGAVTGDLLPLARRMRFTLEETVGFLREAGHLRVVLDLSLGTRGAVVGQGRSWEVGLSPVLLRGEGMDALVTAVVCEHQRRRDEDYRDWALLLAEYVGIREGGPPARRCLRRVLLAFLDTGEDVVDEGCGACSGCCPDGAFLPLAARASRIVALPPELWSRLKAVRKAVDILPDIEIVRGICAFLGRAEGVRWRPVVYLNTERMLREDSGSVGATALLICFVAHRWLERDETDLHRLFDVLWQKRATLAGGLARLAELAAEAQPCSVVTACWRARAVHAEDTAAGVSCWQALLNLDGAPREVVHEASSALAAGGDSPYALLAARTCPATDEARCAYTALRQLDLRSAAVLLEESVAILDAVGSERARAETFVGLLLAALDRGAPAPDLADMLDAGWSRLETALSGASLVRMLEALAGPLAADKRWPVRFIPFLAGEESAPLRGAILSLCARFLEQGGNVADLDRNRMVAALCRIDPTYLSPAHAAQLLTATAGLITASNAAKLGPIFARAGAPTLWDWSQRDPVLCTALLGCAACAAMVPCAVLKHLWDWAIARQRADVVRALQALDLPPEGRAFRRSLLEGWMVQLLSARPRLARASERVPPSANHG